jgi:general secretion pathway protein I
VKGHARKGFTLLEVMIGLAILGFSLTVLIQSASGSMNTALKAQMMGVATDLSRSKMYDIEEKLIKEGYTDTDQSEEGKTFQEEGWPSIRYSYKVEQVELPSFDELQGMTQDRAAGSAGSGSGGASNASAFQNSALGGMMSQLGGGFGGGGSGGAGIDAKQGGAFIQGQYTMIQQVLKVSIRKVTLTVTYPAGGDEQSMTTVAFFTDAGAMDKVLSGLGSTDIDDSGSGSGSGRGSGSGSSGSGRGSGSSTRPPRGGR